MLPVEGPKKMPVKEICDSQREAGCSDRRQTCEPALQVGGLALHQVSDSLITCHPFPARSCNGSLRQVMESSAICQAGSVALLHLDEVMTRSSCAVSRALWACLGDPLGITAARLLVVVRGEGLLHARIWREIFPILSLNGRTPSAV